MAAVSTPTKKSVAADDNSTPSICIPSVSMETSVTDVKKVFIDLKWGFVERIDLPIKISKAGNKYRQVFVHFRNWFKGDDAQAVRTAIEAGEKKEIDSPNSAYPWTCVKSHIAKPTKTTTSLRNAPGAPVRASGGSTSRSTPKKAGSTGSWDDDKEAALISLTRLCGNQTAEIASLREEVSRLKKQLFNAKKSNTSTTRTTIAPPKVTRQTQVTECDEFVWGDTVDDAPASPKLSIHTSNIIGVENVVEPNSPVFAPTSPPMTPMGSPPPMTPEGSPKYPSSPAYHVGE